MKLKDTFLVSLIVIFLATTASIIHKYIWDDWFPVFMLGQFSVFLTNWFWYRT